MLLPMAGADSWSTQYAFWKSMPASSPAVFLAAVFFMFAPGGLLSDIPQTGASGPLRLTASLICAGGIAMAYVTAVRQRPRWLLVVVGVHMLIASQFDRLLGPGAPHARATRSAGGCRRRRRGAVIDRIAPSSPW
jgi:hypothetical protein